MKPIRMVKKRLWGAAVFLCLFQAIAADSTPSVSLPAFRLPAANTRFENITFVIYDTETTGFSPVKDRLVEIGAIKVRNGVEVDRATWLINPQRYIPYYVQNVHHITPEMVAEKPTFAEIYPEFLEFIDGSVLIAHNARFDNRFIAAEAVRNNMPPPKNAVLDSLTLFRRWHPELGDHTVSSLIDYYGLDAGQGKLHRATDDSFFVYKAIQAELLQQGDQPRFQDLTKVAGILHFADGD